MHVNICNQALLSFLKNFWKSHLQCIVMYAYTEASPTMLNGSDDTDCIAALEKATWSRKEVEMHFSLLLDVTYQFQIIPKVFFPWWGCKYAFAGGKTCWKTSKKERSMGDKLAWGTPRAGKGKIHGKILVVCINALLCFLPYCNSFTHVRAVRGTYPFFQNFY